MQERPHVSARERGVRRLSEYTLADSGGAATHQKLADDLKDIAPDVDRYIVEFGYGEIYSRPGLTNQQRVLITIASFPRVLNALYVVKRVFAQRQVEIPQP